MFLEQIANLSQSIRTFDRPLLTKKKANARCTLSEKEPDLLSSDFGSPQVVTYTGYRTFPHAFAMLDECCAATFPVGAAERGPSLRQLLQGGGGMRRRLNLLDTLLRPGGLGDCLVNAQEIRAIAWQRAAREAISNPDLARLMQHLAGPTDIPLDTPSSPLILTRVRTNKGELRFLSTFTTFGMPLDITVASLRIEHLIPADAHTWQRMKEAYELWSAAGAETAHE